MAGAQGRPSGMTVVAGFMVFTLLDPGRGRSESVPSAGEIALAPVASERLDRPLFLTHAGDGSGRTKRDARRPLHPLESPSARDTYSWMGYAFPASLYTKRPTVSSTTSCIRSNAHRCGSTANGWIRSAPSIGRLRA